MKIRGQTIRPVKTTKFLGVILEQSLSWAQQSASALAKGTDWVIQCRRIARPSRGIAPRLIRQLYLAVCVPKMLYAVDVWGAPTPANTSAKGKKCGGQLGRLATVQRQAVLLLGAMRTTATDVLDAHANLLP
ncbi:hypothetical protein BD410DRAFT_710382, partial [Rickenella mellea]